VTTKPTIAFVTQWRRALLASDLLEGTKVVAVALGEHMNGQGVNARPGLARLARECGLSPRTVRRHRLTLVAYGWLAVVVRGGSDAGGTRRPNEYVARIPPSPLTVVPDARPGSVLTPVAAVGPGSPLTPVRDPTRVTADTRPGSRVTVEPGSRVTPKGEKEGEKEAGRVPAARGVNDSGSRRADALPQDRNEDNGRADPADLLDHPSSERAAELRAHLDALDIELGRSRVALAVAGEVGDGRRYVWPSQARDAVRRRAASLPPPEPPKPDPDCGRCRGEGVLFDATGAVSGRCDCWAVAR
jgi:hypothetical protein